jgi:hypothetical protein
MKAIQIFSNVINGPPSVLAPLNHSTIDCWSTLGKILAQKRSTADNKQNSVLLPYAYKLFKNITLDRRSELLESIHSVRGLKALLGDVDLGVPTKLNLQTIASMIEVTYSIFKNYYGEMLKEANSSVIAKIRKVGIGSEKILPEFLENLQKTSVTFVSWLKYEAQNTKDYSLSYLQDLLFM